MHDFVKKCKNFNCFVCLRQLHVVLSSSIGLQCLLLGRCLCATDGEESKNGCSQTYKTTPSKRCDLLVKSVFQWDSTVCLELFIMPSELGRLRHEPFGDLIGISMHRLLKTVLGLGNGAHKSTLGWDYPWPYLQPMRLYCK